MPVYPYIRRIGPYFAACGPQSAAGCQTPGFGTMLRIGSICAGRRWAGTIGSFAVKSLLDALNDPTNPMRNGMVLLPVWPRPANRSLGPGVVQSRRRLQGQVRKSESRPFRFGAGQRCRRVRSFLSPFNVFGHDIEAGALVSVVPPFRARLDACNDVEHPFGVFESRDLD